MNQYPPYTPDDGDGTEAFSAMCLCVMLGIAVTAVLVWAL